MVQDGTPEAVMEILSGNPNGLLHLRDELAGWLMSFERYSPGGREFWLEAYGGRHFVVDRKSFGGAPMHVPFNGVTVLGGIQPDKLSACLLKSADDGLVARFLWAWPNSQKYVRPTKIADVGALEQVYRKLTQLEACAEPDGTILPEVLLLDEDAADYFEKWIQSNDAAIPEAYGMYKGFLGKLRGTVLRLSLVVELLSWAAGTRREPTRVSLSTLEKVTSFIDNYAKPSALRVFGDAALPDVERNAAALARYILKTEASSINLRDVRRKSGIPALKTTDDVNAATEALVDACWLCPAPTRSGDTPGKARKDYIVNPTVHTAA
jgi:hypothetical protein